MTIQTDEDEPVVSPAWPRFELYEDDPRFAEAQSDANQILHHAAWRG
jgi:hypothetical protein